MTAPIQSGAAEAPSSHKRLEYKVGDTHVSGEKIAFIYGHSTSAIVFKDERGHVQWETTADAFTVTEVLVHQRYDRLQARVLACIPAGNKRDELIDELAQALFLGLTEPNEPKALGYFADVDARISQEAQVKARFVYLKASSYALIGILAIGLPLLLAIDNSDVRLVALGSLAASVGAWASLLSRAAKLELGPFEPLRNLAFQAVTRILLGMIFGIVAVVALKTGVVFPAADDSLWSTALVTFVSGWSERLIPEIIGAVESRNASGSGPRKAGAA